MRTFRAKATSIFKPQATTYLKGFVHPMGSWLPSWLVITMVLMVNQKLVEISKSLVETN